MTKPKLDNYKKALETLNVAMESPPKSQLERDGIIQRFEYCLEVSWGVSKKVLEYHQIPTDSPRNVFRELAKNGWIDDPEIWIHFLEVSQNASKVYDVELAERVFNLVPTFSIQSKKLYNELKKRMSLN